MKITFYLGEKTEEKRILSFELENCERIEKTEIFSADLAAAVLKNKALTVQGLLEIFRFHLGGEFSLETYLQHVLKHGFFSPYQPALKIEIVPKGKKAYVPADIQGI